MKAHLTKDSVDRVVRIAASLVFAVKLSFSEIFRCLIASNQTKNSCRKIKDMDSS